MAQRAAVDFEAFYATRPRPPADPEEVVVISVDGKGIVMRPEALRAATATAAAKATNKLETRLSKGEKRNRKRMAEVGAVYTAVPVPRTAADVLAPAADHVTPKPAPKAKAKWVTASVVNDAATVVADVFDEAERRDPDHHRTWVALVDGNNHQIERIRAEAARRNLKVTTVIDFVHVIEYLWKAAWSFHPEGDPAAETWVHDNALAVLDGQASIVAASIRRKATRCRLDSDKRTGADRAADYLLNKKRYLDYPTALTNGWPIATGVIEGACQPRQRPHGFHHRRPLGPPRRRSRPSRSVGSRLGQGALQEPPPWLHPLGPVPGDPADRLQWAERAGVVASYRELSDVEGDDPLGERPDPTHPASQARWDAANEALHGPPPAGEVSDEDLQAIVDRGEQLAGQAPAIVVEDLRRAESQARAAETDLGLEELTGAKPAAGDVELAVPVEDRAAAARAEASRRGLAGRWGATTLG